MSAGGLVHSCATILCADSPKEHASANADANDRLKHGAGLSALGQSRPYARPERMACSRRKRSIVDTNPSRCFSRANITLGEIGLRLQFVGTGDAFGSGGRFNTCFRVERAEGDFLIDCGASSLIALWKSGIEPNSIRTIFVTHLHGDHFGGLPFFVLDGQFYSRRQTPLTLVGPPGFKDRLARAMEVFFPGSSTAKRKFETIIHEVAPGSVSEIDGITLTAVEMRHSCGSPALGLRFQVAGKAIAYSGDGEWSDALIELGRGADLFIAEALSFDKKISQHLDYASIRDNAARIGAKKIMITHFGPDMLARLGDAEHEAAEDGLIVQI